MRAPTVPLVRRGSGEPVLLIHPFALSHHAWSDVGDVLAESHDVLAVTMAGHWGGPRVRHRDFSVTRLADELERVMDEAGWDTAHLVGNSLGGWVAFELERRGRARSVTAIAPAGGWRHISVSGIWIGLRFLAFLPLIIPGYLLGELAQRLTFVHKLVLRTLVHDVAKVSKQGAADLVRASTHCRAYLTMLWAALRDGGVTGLDAVRAPTLLALCARDTLLPPRRYGSMYLNGLPGHAERIVLPEVGHVPMLENPLLVAETIATFIGRQVSAPDVAQPAALPRTGAA